MNGMSILRNLRPLQSWVERPNNTNPHFGYSFSPFSSSCSCSCSEGGDGRSEGKLRVSRGPEMCGTIGPGRDLMFSQSTPLKKGWDFISSKPKRIKTTYFVHKPREPNRYLDSRKKLFIIELASGLRVTSSRTSSTVSLQFKIFSYVVVVPPSSDPT